MNIFQSMVRFQTFALARTLAAGECYSVKLELNCQLVEIVTSVEYSIPFPFRSWRVVSYPVPFSHPLPPWKTSIAGTFHVTNEVFFEFTAEQQTPKDSRFDVAVTVAYPVDRVML